MLGRPRDRPPLSDRPTPADDNGPRHYGAPHRDLGPWIASWERDIDAIKSFMLASRYAHRYEPGAGPHLQRAVELDPDFIAPRVWLIPALAQSGRRQEAEDHYRHLQTLEAGARPF